ncbi:MAG: FHA domain-containing protein [Myxococcales bacterium]|nr:FHA domain-containing protein [Myxococcales bacterium]
MAPARPVGRGRARLTLIRIDGSEGGAIDIEAGPVVFGRSYGSPFDGDFYLSPRHCAFTVLPDGLVIDDITGANGVYRKLEGRMELQHGDTFRVGQELLFYEDLPEPAPLDDGTERMGSPNPGYWGRVSVILEGGIASEAFPIEGEEFTIGRERGDLTFPLDGYVSSSHCRIFGDDNGIFLEDRGSSNGTYVRLRPGVTVPYGALILAGQQLFRVDRA